MNVKHAGPDFQLESDRAIIVLGHSERKEVGELLSSALDSRGLFREIDTITLNRGAAAIGRTSLRKAMESSTVFTHSAGVIRVPRALQIVAINPPEPTPLGLLLRRGLSDVPADPIAPEEGAHETGFADMFKAGVEIARSPVTSLVTIARIARGFSTVERLASGEEDFRAGRAIVHSELDSFGFCDAADLDLAADSGVTTVTLPNHYHNELLFAPTRTLDQLTPSILPVST